jgi:hypothetical protein
MQNKTTHNPEKKEISVKKAEKLTLHDEKESGKEIIATSKEFVEGVSEVVQGVEEAEGAEGNITELSAEDKRKIGDAGGGASAASKKREMPSIEIMQIQVATQIKKEIRILEKEAAKMIKNPNEFSAFKLNGIIAKIRELKDILASMAFATVDAIKGWWVKFVKGLTT